MWSRWARGSVLPLCAWVALNAAITGCGAKSSTAPEASERLNVDKPNANAQITFQTIFGDAGKYTTLYTLRGADDGSIGFRGTLSSVAGVGVLNASGTVRWFKPVNYATRDIFPLTSTAVVPHGLVVVGARDANNDGDSETGYFSLFSSTGDLLSEVVVASDSSNLWLTGAVTADESTFVACGAEKRLGIEHPYLAVMSLKAPGQIGRGGTKVVQTVAGWFNDLTVLPSSPTVLVLGATSVNGTSRSIHGLRISWPGFDPVAVEWSHDILPTTGAWRRLSGIKQAGGNLYVAGTVEDNRKPPPAGGSQWTSGLVASYTGSGDVRWLTTVSLTNHSEGFYSLIVGADAVYGVGEAARSVFAQTDEFGYGLLSKLDLATGQVLANLTMGEDRYDGGLNSAIATTGGLICGGWTQYELSGGPYRGWFSTVDVSSTPGVSATPAPAAAPDGRGDSFSRGARLSTGGQRQE